MKNARIKARSVLSLLRALVPQRETTFIEALRIAELQAQRFLREFGVDVGPVSEDLLLQLPRLTIEYVARMPTSGCSFWDTGRTTWVIQVNSDEPATRQRFTMFHEYKHIIDHGRAEVLYGSGHDAALHAEQTADYFAGCVLMSRPFMKRAWGSGFQTAAQLADIFDVSSVAASVRIAQIGLADGPQSASPARPLPFARSNPRRSGRYHRQYSTRAFVLQEAL